MLSARITTPFELSKPGKLPRFIESSGLSEEHVVSALASLGIELKHDRDLNPHGAARAKSDNSSRNGRR
jgi:hypothetical protein